MRLEPTSLDIICAVDCYPPHAFTIVGLALGVGLALLTKRWRYVPVAALIATTLLWTIEASYRSLSLGEAPFAYLTWLLKSHDLWVRAAFDFGSNLIVVSVVFALKWLILWAINSAGSIGLRGAILFAVCLIVGAGAFAVVLATAPAVLPRRIVERAMDLAGQPADRCKPGEASAVSGLPTFRGVERRETSPVPRMSSEQEAWPAVYTTQMGGIERLLTRRRAIRVNTPGLYGRHRAVALRLAINERGNVVAASPAGGPPQLHAQAIAIASQWRFKPFTRDGKPTSVRLERERVTIEGPELWSTAPQSFPRFTDWNTVHVHLGIFGHEGALSLVIRGDGTVTFDGKGALIALPGRHCATISRQSLEALVGEVRRSNVFSMRESYRSANDSIVVQIGLDDHIKEVHTSMSDREESPDNLWQLVDAILESVHAERWIRGDRFTAPSLVAERWDFSRNDAANTQLLAGVAARGDPDAVRTLVNLGAPSKVNPVADMTESPLAVIDKRTAIERAADHGQFETVDVLLASPIEWGPEALTGTYIAALEFGNAEMAARLLARGARETGSNAGNKTALMAAARSGLPNLVASILKAKPDVGAHDDVPLTALHWAAGADYLKTVDSIHADRPAVIDLLIKAGATVDARGHNRWSPLLGNWMGLEDVTAALIAHGANVNAQDDDGLTPLMTNKSVGSVRRLLNAGANPYLRNRDGKTALDVARDDVAAGDIASEIERWMATGHGRRSNR